MATINNNSPIDMKQLWQKMEDFPVASSAISAMTAVEDGDNRYIYYLVGSQFFRYDLKSNSLNKLASPLVTPTIFASLRYSRFGETVGRVISSPSSTTLRIGGLNTGMLNTYKLRITSGAGAGQWRMINASAEPVKYDQGLATIASTSFIGDSTKKWKVNQWSGYTARLTYGAGMTQIKEILYNDTTTLYFSDTSYQAIDSFK